MDGQPWPVSKTVVEKPLEAEILCVFLPGMEKTQVAADLRDEIQQKAGIILPVDPYKEPGWNRATVGCKTEADARCILQSYEQGRQFQLRWHAGKSVQDMAQKYPIVAALLCVTLHNIPKDHTPEDVRKEVEQKAGVTLKVKPWKHPNCGVATIGLSFRDEVQLVLEAFQKRASPFMPKKV